MFYSIKGIITHTDPSIAVIECGGVGFKCLTTANTLSRLPALGQTATLFTHLNVREGALDLYGFGDTEELHCFKLLISVTGVGPKAAVAVLSELPPAKFAMCVAAGDSKSITRAQGIGTKIAQRIILELKDKLSAGISSDSDGLSAAVSLDASSNASEAVAALVVLGFSASQASSAVGRLDSSLPVEDLIRLSLKTLGGM